MARDEYPELQRAVYELARRCDGAYAEDDVGFNKHDTDFGKDLDEQDEWTPKQARAAYEMLYKYRGQLRMYGISYKDIPEPEPPKETVTKEPTRDTDVGYVTAVEVPWSDDIYFGLKFDYNPDVNDELKDHFDYASWYDEGEVWLVGSSVPDAELLLDFVHADGEIDSWKWTRGARDRLKALRDEKKKRQRRADALLRLSQATETDLSDLNINGELYPFQRAAVKYVQEQRRVFICDQTGTGKTVEALASLQVMDAFPAVITVPSTLKTSWAREALRWLPDRRVAVLEGQEKGGYLEATRHEGRVELMETDAPIHEFDLYLLNYAILGYCRKDDDGNILARPRMEELQGLSPGAVVFDESHKLKNHESQRSENAEKLARGVPVRLLLSATPTPNGRPKEYIHQLNILDRLEDIAPGSDDDGPFWSYAKYFCNAYRSRYGWDLTGANNKKELNRRLRRTCYVRRTKQQVLTQLPEKQYSTIPLEISNRSEYETARQDFFSWLLTEAGYEDYTMREAVKNLDVYEEVIVPAKSAEQLVRMEKMKQLAARGKLDNVVRWANDFLETEEKLIIFAHHRSIIHELEDRLSDHNPVSLLGGMTDAETDEAERRFQACDRCGVRHDDHADVDGHDYVYNDTALFLGSMQAAGHGLDLTASSSVAFVELGWNPKDHTQPENRVHRIGQEEQVNVYFLVAHETIEDVIANLIESKRANVSEITEGETISGSIIDLDGQAAPIKLVNETLEQVISRQDRKDD